MVHPMRTVFLLSLPIGSQSLAPPPPSPFDGAICNLVKHGALDFWLCLYGAASSGLGAWHEVVDGHN
jgi:hypothetical protein